MTARENNVRRLRADVLADVALNDLRELERYASTTDATVLRDTILEAVNLEIAARVAAEILASSAGRRSSNTLRRPTVRTSRTTTMTTSPGRRTRR